MRRVVPALVVLALCVACSAGARTERVGPCTGAALAGSFELVPGSPGAGNVVYALRVRNRARATCFVTGIPALTLLDAKGRKLPTHPVAARPGELTAVIVQLTPGASARLTARFSPDVPGQGEPATRTSCEPKAYRLRVATSGRAAVVVPIEPPTPVCEHGGMQLTAFAKA